MAFGSGNASGNTPEPSDNGLYASEKEGKGRPEGQKEKVQGRMGFLSAEGMAEWRARKNMRIVEIKGRTPLLAQ